MKWENWHWIQSGSIVWRRALYAFISGATPFAVFLTSEEPITVRKLSAVLLGSLIAAATADRAFLDPSHHAPAAAATLTPGAGK